MANIFAITAATNRVKLNSKRQAEVAFTISNAEERPMRGRAHILPEGEADSSWFTLDGEPEQTFAIAGTQQYTVQIEVPPDAPSGDYFFRLNMVGVENPDEDFAEGPSVSFAVPEPEEKKKPFPWWILLIILAVIIIGGAAAFLLTRGEPELAVSVEVSADPVIAGRDMSYTIQVNNTGNKAAENVIVNNTLPAGVTFLSASEESCALGEDNEAITCTLAEGVARNGTSEITLNVSVDGAVRGMMTNTVMLETADPAITPEVEATTEPEPTPEGGPATDNPTPSGEAAIASMVVGQVALTVDNTGPTSASADEEVIYQIMVGNNGPSHATEVILTYPRPEGILGATGVSQKGNCGETEDSVQCELGLIEAGASLPITITILPGPEVVGTLESLVTIVDGDGSSVSSQAVATQITPATGLAVAVNASGSQALIGVPFIYTVQIWNSSPVAANNVEMRYLIPDGWEFISTEPECPQLISAGTTTLICDFGNLPPDPEDIRSVAITLQASDEGTITNNFNVSSSLPLEQVAVDTRVAKAFSAVGVHFDGKNDWVELDEFNVPETFTIEMWVNPEASRDKQSFVAKHTVDGDNIFVMGYYNGGLEVNLRGQVFQAGTKPTNLYHLAVVVEKRTLSQSFVTVYQDGEVKWDEELVSVLGTDISGRPWVLGQEWDTDTASDFYDGAIAEVRFWDHARTQEQINSLMDDRLNGDEDGLITYLPLTEQSGTTATDLTGNGHDGTLMAGALWVDAAVPENFGSALALTGVNDNVLVPDSASLRLNTFSIGVWVRPTQLQPNWQQIVTKHDIVGTTRNYGLFISPNAMTVNFTFMDSTCSQWRGISTSNSSLIINEWNFVMGTYDGASVNLYINGVLDRTAAVTGGACQNAEPLIFGNERRFPLLPPAFSPFLGNIDEVRIYNRALTLAEMQATMNQVLQGNETGLVGYWRFDENAGTTVYDVSGDGNDGAIIGGNWIISGAGQ